MSSRMPSAVLQQLDRYGPDRCEPTTYDDASAYAQQLATTHYENFSVLSRLLPAHLRPDFAHVYAFCRWADDLGDETGSRERSLELLAWWRRELDACYAGGPRHPVFVALRQTTQRHGIPRRPFDDLIDAFVQDQTVTRYDTWEQVLDYCTRSADPVGRLVLYMAGHRDEERQRLSDATCTALQLANFWQDVRRDIIERDRVYIPRELATRHGLDVPLMREVIRGCPTADRPSAEVHAILPAYRAAVAELVARTWPLFRRGRNLWPLLDREIRPQIKLYTFGGESILRMIERRRFDTLTQRPSLGRAGKLALLLRVLAATLVRR